MLPLTLLRQTGREKTILSFILTSVLDFLYAFQTRITISHVICISFTLWLWLLVHWWSAEITDDDDTVCFAYKRPNREFIVTCIGCFCIMEKLSHDVLRGVGTSWCDMCCLAKIVSDPILWYFVQVFMWLIRFRFSLHQISVWLSIWETLARHQLLGFDSYKK